MRYLRSCSSNFSYTNFRATLTLFVLCVGVISFVIGSAQAQAPNENPQEVRIGMVASLSSFGANFGTAVLEGAKLAVEELESKGVKVDLKVEDDQSMAKNALTAYQKLKSTDKVQGIIGATWWSGSYVKQAERDNLPHLSCETLYHKDEVTGKTTFFLQGHLHHWIRAYEPLVDEKSWQRGAIVRFVSGFGATLESEMKSLFTKKGRSFVGAVEYNDIHMADAADVVLKLKKMKPDVVYLDAQPGAIALLLKKLTDSGMTDLSVIGNLSLDSVRSEKSADLSPFRNVFFTKRMTFDEGFSNRFKAEYGKEPYLNSDIGYYSVYLLIDALKSADPVSSLQQGLTANGKTFTFDPQRVSSDFPSDVFQIKEGKVIKWGN